ncbi:DUF2332 domain-containing protein [Curtobacterium sp. ODYSSEY 48 V2]|uniref:DUF2332 family protein n=1 Tax=unclassified Curtobacterium TaxID=257496 RepID=UPI001AE15439|nr:MULTISPECIES: DUF2332 family protein [unclassified Curtobacterium]MBP1302638.1 hypothetical protein [Curtobacterium sp. 1310]MCM3505759.1 DUF2332 domain-containing protein [Curtobacterium sp. ODYSSEY 48 V2]MDT0211621.1 DUF2332 family protein [Curtobacterium sp. BRD11]
MTGTRERYATYAARIAPASPSYAAWARSVDDDLVALLDAVPEQQRQPELVFAVARRLGADPSDPGALRALGREARAAFVTALAAATVQANDPRRLGPVVPLFAALAAADPRPLGLVDAGAAAGLCSIPDRVTLDHRTGDGTVRVHTAVAEPSVHLTVDASGAVPEPAGTPIRIGARVALDPNPIDLAEPGAFDRLVEAVPPEATDRTALMREAARATLAVPPVRIRGTLPGDLDRALDALPDGVRPVVLTTGTLVYVPGADRQRVVDRLAERGVHWVAVERTGILRGVAATLPDDVDPADPDAFATVSLDGVATAVCDPFGVRVRWFRRPAA